MPGERLSQCLYLQTHSDEKHTQMRLAYGNTDGILYQHQADENIFDFLLISIETAKRRSISPSIHLYS